MGGVTDSLGGRREETRAAAERAADAGFPVGVLGVSGNAQDLERLARAGGGVFAAHAADDSDLEAMLSVRAAPLAAATQPEVPPPPTPSGERVTSGAATTVPLTQRSKTVAARVSGEFRMSRIVLVACGSRNRRVASRSRPRRYPGLLMRIYSDTVSRALDCVGLRGSILNVQEARLRSNRSPSLPGHDLRRLATILMSRPG